MSLPGSNDTLLVCSIELRGQHLSGTRRPFGLRHCHMYTRVHTFIDGVPRPNTYGAKPSWEDAAPMSAFAVHYRVREIFWLLDMEPVPSE